MEFEDRIKQLQIPKVLESRDKAGRALYAVAQGRGVFCAEDAGKVESLARILTGSAAKSMIASGRLGLGLIKPNVQEGRDLPADDQSAAQVILEEIGSERLLLQFPFRFTARHAVDFYAPNKEKYSNQFQPSGESVWDSTIKQMISGPLTVLLTSGREGDAVSWLRGRIGHWDPKRAEPETIRAKHGRLEILPNSIVHGSDSEENVERELRIIISALRWYARR